MIQVSQSVIFFTCFIHAWVTGGLLEIIPAVKGREGGYDPNLDIFLIFTIYKFLERDKELDFSNLVGTTSNEVL